MSELGDKATVDNLRHCVLETRCRLNVRSSLDARDSMAMFGGPWALAWAAGRLDAVASITLINTPVLINHFAAKIFGAHPAGAEILWRVANARFIRLLAARQALDVKAITLAANGTVAGAPPSGS